METTTKKLLLAVALGSLLGWVVGHWFDSGIVSSAVGMIIGALVGYFSYDFERVYRALPVAWEKAKTMTPEWRWDPWWNHANKRKEVLVRFRFFGSELAAKSCAVFTFLFLPLSIAFFLDTKDSFPLTYGQSIALSVVLSKIIYVFAGLSVAAALSVCVTSPFEVNVRDIPQLMEKNTRLLKRVNPFSGYFYYMPKAIWRAAVFVFRAVIPVVLRFLKTLIVLVHEDLRLLAFVGAALGGLFAPLPNPLYGMIAGIAFAFASHKLVGQRLLRIRVKH